MVLALLALRVKASVAALVSCGVALLAAVSAFPVDRAAADAAVEVFAPLTLEVALIMFGGLALAEIMKRTGAFHRIADELIRASGDRLRAVLVVGVGVTCFTESTTGFGVSVTISAPLLVRMGLGPVAAASIASAGLVTAAWGSLAPGTLVAARLSGTGFAELGFWSAVFTLPVVVAGLAFVLVMGAPRGSRRAGVVPAVVMGTVLWGVLLVANVTVGPPLAGALAGLLGIAALLVRPRRRDGGRPSTDRRLLGDTLPYLLLVTGLAASRLLAPGEPGSTLHEVVSSPALWLLVAAAFAYGRSGGEHRPGFLRAVVTGWRPTATALVLFLLLGAIMTSTGMSAHLALAAAALGGVFVAAVPAIGVVGGAIAGSTSGSSALFAAGVADAARHLDLSGTLVTGSFNAAASYATAAAPPRIALAVTAALPPRTGKGAEAAAITSQVLVRVLGVNVVVMLGIAVMSVLLIV